MAFAFTSEILTRPLAAPVVKEFVAEIKRLLKKQHGHAFASEKFDKRASPPDYLKSIWFFSEKLGNVEARKGEVRYSIAIDRSVNSSICFGIEVEAAVFGEAKHRSWRALSDLTAAPGTQAQIDQLLSQGYSAKLNGQPCESGAVVHKDLAGALEQAKGDDSFSIFKSIPFEDAIAWDTSASEKVVDVWTPLSFLVNAAVERFQQAAPTPSQPAATPTPKEPTMATKPAASSIEHPLNLIFYGPPGTGKTWKARRLAVEICDGTAVDDHDEFERRYEELREAERVRFVTFHQSLGYEEFVEGIRPKMADEESAEDDADAPKAAVPKYEVMSGAFKTLCARASTGASRSGLVTRAPIDNEASVWKFSPGNSRDPSEDWVWEDCRDTGRIRLNYGAGANFTTGANNKKEIEDIIEAKDNNGADHGKHDCRVIHWFKNVMKVGDVIVVSQGVKFFRAIGVVEGPYEWLGDLEKGFAQARSVRWIYKPDAPEGCEALVRSQFAQQTLYQFGDQSAVRRAVAELLGESKSGGPKPYVMIVDEINRGNISKILGELITLLEPDKRSGPSSDLCGKHPTKATLPYSGDSFGVPNNVYLIGTMNTADRSIAFLDVALRRRFVFEEIEPDVSLPPEDVEGVNARTLLKELNDRIEFFFDRDHRLGHAIFMSGRNGKNLSSLAGLREIFLDKVIPLLREYFYEDDEKVAAILGCPYTFESGQVTRAFKHDNPILSAAMTNTSFLPEAMAADHEARPTFTVTKDFRKASGAGLKAYFDGLIAPMKAPSVAQQAS